LPNDEYIKYNDWLTELVADINAKAAQVHIGEKIKELQENYNRQRYPNFYK